MSFFNKIILLGNITRTPEVRYIQGKDTAVARFGLAVNRKLKDKDETMFIDIVAFGKLGEICGQYATKGSPLLIEGRLTQNTWEQDGQRRSKHEIIAESIQLMGSKKDAPNEQNGADAFSEDDIPF